MMPLYTIFKIIIGNYTFRVYDHIPKKKKSRFFVDDNVKYKSRCFNKNKWKNMLLISFKKESIKFSALNDKIIEAVNLFFKNKD